MASVVHPYEYVALRLPSDAVRVEQLSPSTTVSLGKFGSFNTNHILGRPFHLTYEILDKPDTQDGNNLRIVSSIELNTDALIDGSLSADDDVVPGTTFNGNGVSEIQELMKSNQDTIDGPSAQTMSREEVEILKQDTIGTDRGIIDKLLGSHSVIDQKTAFSLAKYTLRKNKKHLRRFTVLPLDVSLMVDWIMNNKDFTRILDLRNETLGLMGCWANVHYFTDKNSELPMRRGRWLMFDDTGGLVIAAMAERMGILRAEHRNYHNNADSPCTSDESSQRLIPPDFEHRRRDALKRNVPAMSGRSNTITLIHANTQPNLTLLKYFGFDVNIPSPDHPLFTQLKTLSWLQLLEPEADPVYAEPDVVPPETLATMKSNRRGVYFRKRRRWERVKTVIDETQAGEFDGLIISSAMLPSSILHHTVPLLAGSAQVVIYNPYIEPLVEIADIYSTARRTAFLNTLPEQRKVPSQDFPLDPTLLLGPTIQTSRVRKWQALPGRTHPLMSAKGGAEGYLFHATKVIPAGGKVVARGKGIKRRKVDNANIAVTQGSSPIRIDEK
ncbi:MAG: hypothetical protein Q9160_004094 [Pyrenula sp. 1 TL-2023]